MIGKYSVCMVVPCYKRPELVERLIESVINHCVPVDKILVMLMPENIKLGKEYDKDLVEVISRPQANCPRARNIAIQYVLDNYDYNLIWLTDDDVYYDEGIKELPEYINIFDRPDIGIVSITRRVGSYKYSPEICYDDFVYIGGGNLFKPQTFKLIEGYDNIDGADELMFTLKAFLAGYQNARLRSCSAIHEQGKASEGGLYALVREKATVDIQKDTCLTNPNLFIDVKSERMKYGNIISYDAGGLKNAKLTQYAKMMHRYNKQKLLKNTLKTEDIPFTSKYNGDIWIKEVK